MRYAGRLVLGLVVIALGATIAASAESDFGHFEGRVVASFLPDGRNMRLEAPFSYVDAKGRRWDVPKGLTTDGASIPRVFWITDPPFTGKYRDAAVIHDHYCQTKSRTWQETHNAFYEAMRAAGVEDKKAKVMWVAVYNFGPKWGPVDRSRRDAVPTKYRSLEGQEQLIRELEAWVQRDNPSREEMDRAVQSGHIP